MSLAIHNILQHSSVMNHLGQFLSHADKKALSICSKNLLEKSLLPDHQKETLKLLIMQKTKGVSRQELSLQTQKVIKLKNLFLIFKLLGGKENLKYFSEIRNVHALKDQPNLISFGKDLFGNLFFVIKHSSVESPLALFQDEESGNFKWKLSLITVKGKYLKEKYGFSKNLTLIENGTIRPFCEMHYEILKEIFERYVLDKKLAKVVQIDVSPLKDSENYLLNRIDLFFNYDFTNVTKSALTALFFTCLGFMSDVFSNDLSYKTTKVSAIVFSGMTAIAFVLSWTQQMRAIRRWELF
jgi:hypothetical protein